MNATYGQLMLRAAFGIRHGLAYVHSGPLRDAAEARRLVSDYLDVLSALTDQAHTILERRRLPGIAATPTPDPRERAAQVMADALHGLTGGRPVSRTEPSGAPVDGWARAAQAIRAASDLLATHSDRLGLARTPDFDVVLRAMRPRQAGLAQVGDLAATLLDGTDRLALRAAQAGVPRAEVAAALPEAGALHALARDVAGTGVLPNQPALESLTVALPAIRVATPLEEIADRMHHVRQLAWEHSHADGPALDDLKVFATLGIAVHAHALAAEGHSPGSLRGHLPGEPRLRAMVARGRGWHDVARALYPLRSPRPADPRATAELRNVTQLLQSIAPLKSASPPPAAASRGVREVLAGGIAVQADVARWNGRALARIQAGTSTHVSGLHLSGSQVSDDPSLVTAKLDGTMVAVPATRFQPLLDDYGALSGVEPASTLQAVPPHAPIQTVADYALAPIARSEP